MNRYFGIIPVPVIGNKSLMQGAKWSIATKLYPHGSRHYYLGFSGLMKPDGNRTNLLPFQGAGWSENLTLFAITLGWIVKWQASRRSIKSATWPTDFDADTWFSKLRLDLHQRNRLLQHR